MPRLFDDLQFAPVTYATCMWCHNIVSNPDSVWERQEDDSWMFSGHVGTSKACYPCRDGIAETFKIRRRAEHATIR